MEDKDNQTQFYIQHIKNLITDQRFDSLKFLLAELKTSPEYSKIQKEPFDLSSLFITNRPVAVVEQNLCLDIVKTGILNNHFLSCNGKNHKGETFLYFPFYQITWKTLTMDLGSITGVGTIEEAKAYMKDMSEIIQDVFNKDPNIKNNYKLYAAEIKRVRSAMENINNDSWRKPYSLSLADNLMSHLETCYLNNGLGENPKRVAPKM